MASSDLKTWAAHKSGDKASLEYEKRRGAALAATAAAKDAHIAAKNTSYHESHEETKQLADKADMAHAKASTAWHAVSPGLGPGKGMEHPEVAKMVHEHAEARDEVQKIHMAASKALGDKSGGKFMLKGPRDDSDDDDDKGGGGGDERERDENGRFA